MSGKLDQSLDDIVKTRRTTTRRTARTRAGTRTARAAPPAPTGGVSKKPVVKHLASKAAITVPAALSGESKILVSGLPSDVSEQQIKDYFGKTIGPVKRVFLTYGPTGQSRGISPIVFSKSTSAAEAVKQLNGVKVDNRAMKIEVILGANQTAAALPVKTLGDRVKPTAATTKTKNQPKSAVASKAAPAAGRPSQKPARGRGRNAGRGKPKTAEELDAEMVDYFDVTAAAAATGTNGAAAANGAQAAGGDAGMDDEIM